MVYLAYSIAWGCASLVTMASLYCTESLLSLLIMLLPAMISLEKLKPYEEMLCDLESEDTKCTETQKS